MKKDNLIVDGDPPIYPFRVKANREMQTVGYKTLQDARASVKRLDVNFEIFEGRTRVFGKPLPKHHE